jgi:beta-N-acetylhexosaminidase
VFGSPYSLSYFEKQRHVVVAYEDTEHALDLVPQVLFGGIAAKGQLPVTASDGYQFGAGITSSGPIRFSYGLPEELDYSSWTFARIDSLALQAIRERATPGCQVLVAKDGKVIYEKAFGHHTYDSTRPVALTDLYDVASLTKIAATTITLMYLYDLGLYLPYQVLSDYLPQLKGTVMGRLKMNDILTHTAGLKAWIPFFQSTTHPDIYEFFYCDYGDDTYCIPVARDLFLLEGYVDTMLAIIAKTPLEKPGNYKYSDLGFYMLADIIKALTQEPLDEFAQNHFYRPLGLQHCRFHPLMQFPLEQIVPTQDDKDFRRQLVHGYVHDPGAAMMGGVSGHAGLFSNAHDIGVIMQMLLNKGTYAGERYLKEETVDLFTRRYDKRSRRGLGFDKPETDLRIDGPTSKLVSPETFGHTGFTGTCAWADPNNGLVYVFLSNRIHPDQENKKLIRMNTRTMIQGRDILSPCIRNR